MDRLVDSKASNVFKNFIKLNKIPRCSYNEQAVSDFLKKFGESLGYESKQDQFKNVLIRKPASEGYEDRQPVCLQGHMDMVCEKTDTCNHDFEKDPIDMYIDGQYVKAKGTTLGADDGIGVAMAMDILEDKDLKHPELEVLITATEETGMDGAMGLSKDWLKAKRLINIDTEKEGVVIVGCAGGVGAEIRLDLDYEEDDQKDLYEIRVSGLQGGHSGMLIGSSHVNAIKLIIELIIKIKADYKLSLQDLSGGSKDNAIPSTAFARVGVEGASLEDLRNMANELKDFYLKRESDLSISIEKVEGSNKFLDARSQTNLISMTQLLPHGINSMTPDESMVESSDNLAIVSINDGTYKVIISIRSSDQDRKKELMDKISLVAEKFGACVEYDDGYPMWQPNWDSKLLKTAVETYGEFREEKLEVATIHAGLETGLISEKYPDMDMISLGPDIEGAHTPEEKLSVKSTEFVSQYLKRLLEKL